MRAGVGCGRVGSGRVTRIAWAARRYNAAACLRVSCSRITLKGGGTPTRAVTGLDRLGPSRPDSKARFGHALTGGDKPADRLPAHIWSVASLDAELRGHLEMRRIFRRAGSWRSGRAPVSGHAPPDPGSPGVEPVQESASGGFLRMLPVARVARSDKTVFRGKCRTRPPIETASTQKHGRHLRRCSLEGASVPRRSAVAGQTETGMRIVLCEIPCGSLQLAARPRFLRPSFQGFTASPSRNRP